VQGEEGKGAYVTVVHDGGGTEGCRLYYRHAVRLQTTSAHTRHAPREEIRVRQRERRGSASAHTVVIEAAVIETVGIEAAGAHTQSACHAAGLQGRRLYYRHGLGLWRLERLVD
jgi:hypothetical protein